jgi:hypothetical protein
MEHNLDEKLQRLRQSLGRIKALLAWQQLKGWEANSSRIDTFEMDDRTVQELKDEYAFFLAALATTHAVIEDRSSFISPPVRQDIEMQLADLDCQLDDLHLDGRL